MQQMAINVIPIIEKGLLDPVITHGCMPHHCSGTRPPAGDMRAQLRVPQACQRVQNQSQSWSHDSSIIFSQQLHEQQ